MNKGILVGRLTADPELQTTNSGVDVCRFSLAINRPFKSQDGETQTDFLNIVVWRAAAQNCARFLRKGSQCAVIGTIQTRSYEDNNGVKRYVTEIVADNVEFLGKPAGQSDDYGEPAPRPQQSQQSKRPAIDKLEPVEDDDLPF